MTHILRKILLAVDGSDQSLDAIRYVSGMVPPENTQIVLFHVITRIEQSFWEMGAGLVSSESMAAITACDVDREKKTHRNL